MAKPQWSGVWIAKRCLSLRAIVARPALYRLEKTVTDAASGANGRIGALKSVAAMHMRWSATVVISTPTSDPVLCQNSAL